MIRLTKGTSAAMYLTLTENQTIVDANYLFVFQSRTTNDKVKFVLVNTADTSTYKDRYNLFTITVNTYFSTKEEGWYKYTVYEQSSTTNTDESLTGDILETGLMFLSDGTGLTFNDYDNPTNFIVYDAQ